MKTSHHCLLAVLTSTLLTTSPVLGALEEDARKIILPSVNVQDATLTETVNFLTHSAASRGLTMNVVIASSVPKDLTVTLSLRKVPLFDALRYLALSSGLEVTYEENAVIFSGKAASASAIAPPSPGVSKVGHWYLDYAAALEAGMKEKKAIMIVFTDLSGGCSPCENLESKIFASKQFASWAKNVVLLRSDKDAALTKKYNRHGVSGIPSVLFVNEAGAAISGTYFGDQSSPGYWVEGAKKALQSGPR